MKIKCPYCNRDLGNADYRATLHTNGYHDLLTKIHEKIELLQNDVNENPNHGSKYLPVIIIQELKSLLSVDAVMQEKELEK